MQERLHSFTKLEFDKLKIYLQRYTSSDLSKELISNLSPSGSLSEIRLSLAYVTEMKKLLEGIGYPPIDAIPDCRLSLQRTSIENFILTSEDLTNVSTVLRQSKNVYVYFSKLKDQYPLLTSKVKALYLNKILEYNINLAIDENGNVKDSATKELSSIRKQISKGSEILRARLETLLKVVSDKEWSQEDIITTRDGRMVIPIKVEHKNKLHGFIHSSSASGATVFIEPTETLELNNDIRTLQFQERREVERILKALTEQVRQCKTDLLNNLEILAELDFIEAKAKYSIEVLGNEPLMKTEGNLKLANARHPLLFQRHKINAIVPLTIEFGNDIKTVIITGPNAGGKSVALKTVGLLCIMAHAGLHIPASFESEIPIFTNIFVDIGDEQSIENDLSSFSSHLANLNQIIRNANKSSLVLIDEIGSGTDPIEGAALSAAILERLTNIGAYTIATTHHGSLKVFAYETPHIENAAMEFNQDTLQPTYRFRYGVPGSSYAIEMAQRISISEDIINNAKTFLGSKTYNLEQLIADLERHSQQLAKQLQEVSHEKIQLEQLKNSYQTKIESLQREIKQIKSSAATEAQEIVNKAHSTVERIVKEIKEQSAEKKIIKNAQEEIKVLSNEVDHLYGELTVESSSDDRFSVGQAVKLKNSNSVGEILEELDLNYYLILIGDLKIKVHKRQLIHSANQTVRHTSTVFANNEAPEVHRELDLRGMYGDEALTAVDKFVDEAIMTGLHRLDIIHGKGTGVLRKRVTEYLKSNLRVKSFRLGEWNEGGTGVTVVELY